MNQKIKAIALGLSLSQCLYANDDWSLNNRITFTGEVVYMRRNSLGKDHILVQETPCPQYNPPCICPPCPEPPPAPPPLLDVLGTKKVINASHFKPGYRVGVWIAASDCQSVEASYMRVGKWHSEKTECGDCCNLRFPFCPLDCVCNFVNAHSASVQFNSQFSTAEANYWEHVTPRRCQYFSYSWLAGFRYFNLEEGLLIAFERGGSRSNYNVCTRNDLYGAQLGINLQINPYPVVSWDFTLKGGILANLGNQKTFLGDYNNQVVLRDYQLDKTVATYMADGSVMLSFQLGRYVNFHLGYEGIYLANLVLPSGQLDDRFRGGGRCCCWSNEMINTSGRVFVQGGFAGLGVGF